MLLTLVGAATIFKGGDTVIVDDSASDDGHYITINTIRKKAPTTFALVSEPRPFTAMNILIFSISFTLAFQELQEHQLRVLND